jgi:transposase
LLSIGDDWAEEHHDVELVDEAGQRLAETRLPEGIVGITRLHELVAAHVAEDAEPGQVVVGIETDRGPWVQALLASGYQVYAINPMQAARYRERHCASGAKSDPGDAHVLAGLVRLDRAGHRPIAGDSDLTEAIKLLARAHQTLIWDRHRHLLRLRGALREFFGRRRRPDHPRHPGALGRRSRPRDRGQPVPRAHPWRADPGPAASPDRAGGAGPGRAAG